MSVPAERLELRRLLTAQSAISPISPMFADSAGEAEAPSEAPAAIRVRFSDAVGRELLQVSRGDAFQIHVDVHDRRDDPLGIFSAYSDVEFDPSLIEITNVSWHLPLQHPDGPFENGLLDEAGGITDVFVQTRQTITPLATIDAVAIADGLLTVSTNSPDAPISQIVLFGLNRDLRNESDYGQAELIIQPASTPPQLDAAVFREGQLEVSYELTGPVDSLDAVLTLQRTGSETQIAQLEMGSLANLSTGSHQTSLDLGGVDFRLLFDKAGPFSISLHLESSGLTSDAISVPGVIADAGHLFVLGSDLDDTVEVKVDQLQLRSDEIRVQSSLAGVNTVHVQLQSGNDTVSAGTSSLPLQIDGGDGDDTLTGGRGADSIDGGSGEDRLFGSNGRDSLSGGDGHDRLFGGNGFDTIDGGPGNDFVRGGMGNDRLNGDTGNDRIFGDDLNDTLIGGTGNDSLSGGNGKDRVFAGPGNDLVDGGRSDDQLFGDAGDDTMAGSAGRDILRGGSDDDSLTGGDGFDTLFGGQGNDTISGGNGNDTVFAGNGLDSVSGDAGDDRLFGNNGYDTISGGLGNDFLRGGRGKDQLWGDAGLDELIGDEHNDTLKGGDHNDTITGGSGSDRADGEAGADTIDVQEAPSLDGIDSVVSGDMADTIFLDPADVLI